MANFVVHLPLSLDPKQRCFEKDASLRLRNVSLDNHVDEPVVFEGEKGDAACGLRALS